MSGRLRNRAGGIVLIDHQLFQFANTRKMDPTMILNNTIGLAKAFKVSTILTTVTKDRRAPDIRST
jgi:hypothetical protein